MMKKTITLVMCVLFLLGCSGGAKISEILSKVANTISSETPTVTVTETATPLPTQKPTQTPVPTKANTPTPKPTATSTAVPESKILYLQDFENGGIDDWENRSETPLKILEEDNNHYLHFTASGFAYPGIWMTDVDSDWVDYAFESRVRFYNGLISFCFYENEYGFYQGGLSYPDGLYFSDYVPNRSESYQTITSAGYPLKNNRWYTVRIEVKDGVLSMYIDGKLSLSAKRDTLPYGGIGFISGSENEGTFDLDDIKVWNLK